MKVLLISNILNESGYSRAAEATLKSLYYAKVDVAARHINLTNGNRQVDQIVQKSLDKSASDCDFLLIHSLPTFFEYDGRFKKCIGKFDYETDMLPSNWKKKCKLMDQIWVSTTQAKDDLNNIEQINKPVFSVPHAVDINRFEKDFSKNVGVIGRHKQKTGAYCFYTIGEFAARKNYEALLQTWYLTFSQKDNVELFIKTSMPNTEPRQAHAKVMQCCEQIKKNLKLNKRYLKDPIVITDSFSEQVLDTFHTEGDCFVSASHAEGMCCIAGTKIKTLSGLKSIEDIQIGETIFNHKGKIDNVITTSNRYYNGDLVSIKVQGLSTYLDFTENHPHYIFSKNWKRMQNIPSIKIPKFIEAKDLKIGDYWVVPKLHNFYKQISNINISDYCDNLDIKEGQIHLKHSYSSSDRKISLATIANILGCDFRDISFILNGKRCNKKFQKKIIKYLKDNNIKKKEYLKIPNKIELNEDFMFFIGHYIAEGHTTIQGSIVLSTHNDEQLGRIISSEAIKNSFGLITKEVARKNKKCTTLTFSNKLIGEFLNKLCGKGAYNKYINSCFKNSKYIGALIRGLFYGDGCASKGKYSFSTISEQLCTDLIEIFNFHNIHLSKTVSSRKNSKTCYILKCPAEQKERFNKFVEPIKYNKKIEFLNSKARYILEDDLNFYLPIQKIIKKAYSGQVYNFGVQNEQSYIVESYATHNCLPARDAILFGKPIIVPNHTGFVDYATCQGATMVPAFAAPCYGALDQAPEIYNGSSIWYNVDILHLKNWMQTHYLQQDRYKKTGQTGKVFIHKYSYANVGKEMVKNLIV